MLTEIIINSSPEETRVALKENGTVTEVYIDRKKDRGIVGNIYKGRVLKVLPGMQAAFIDIGFEKSAFLHASDTFSEEDEYSRMLADEMGEEALEIESDFMRRRRIPSLPIEEILQEGQEIIVQVAKDPIGTKGARVTTYVSLPGRYLVYMPFTEHVGVSRRIADEEERLRLKEVVSRLKGSGKGYIIRTASEGKSEEDFTRDMEFLELLWENLQKKREKAVAPTLIHSEIDLLFRVVRDLFTQEVSQIVVDSHDDFHRLKEFVLSYLPRLSPRIELYEGREPIFDAFNIEIEISRALNRKVWLKSGGYIIIDQAEALTAIDVKTG
ncbi:MAG: Rne/Rng family ribonuclease, partial [Nitrospirota bacterium]|nr:Rne/Rng family ribonuclease [Nitrospirota bacterium]